MKKKTVVFIVLALVAMLAGCVLIVPTEPGEVDETSLTVMRNNSFGDRSSENISGVVNATEIKLGSFVIKAGSSKADTIGVITFTDGEILMGNNFQNLKLKSENIQLGSTKGNLNTTAAGFYKFYLSTVKILPAKAIFVVDIYADIKGNTTNANTLLAGINFYSVTTFVGGEGVEHINVFNLQTMYISLGGDLYVSVDSDTPLSQQLAMGEYDYAVYKVKFEASAVEDWRLSYLVITNAMLNTIGSHVGTLKNVKIYNGSNLLSGPRQFDPGNADPPYSDAVFDNLDFIIPAGSSRILTIKVEVGTAADGAVSGSTHTLRIWARRDAWPRETIRAMGINSGITNRIHFHQKAFDVDKDQVGNTMTVYRTKISAAYAKDTPSGAATGNSAQTVAKIYITNANNVGNYAAIIKSIDFAFSTTIPSNGARRELKIYKGSITVANRVAVASFTERFCDTKIGDSGFADVEIPAGATELFIVTLDTTEGSMTGDFSLSVNLSEGDIIWSDGATAGTNITVVDTLPLESKTLSY